MSFTVRLTETIAQGSNSITQTQSYTAATLINMAETVADSVTDQEHLVAIDVSALQAFYMVSDQAITVETNSGSSPQETFSLTANIPVIFKTGDSAIFSGDVTGFYLTNSSGSTATFQVMAAMDV